LPCHVIVANKSSELEQERIQAGEMVKYIVIAIINFALAGQAIAQQTQTYQPQLANQGTVGVITGMEGGTYARTAADLTILDDDTLRVLPTLGKGSLQNLADILYLKGIDIGFVQSDALAYAEQHNVFPGLADKVRYIAKLYDEEIHVLARGDIVQIQDLNDQRVNVDVVGSGSAMTAEILLSALGINAKLEHDKQINGLEELKHGDIAAIIHVGGAPIPLFADVSGEGGLHFVPVTLTPALAQTYLPDRFTHDSYPRLVPANAPVETIAVGDVMAVFAWPPRTDRYSKVTRFVNAFFSEFDQFQQPPRHPKWREVNLTAQVPGWTRFQPAQDWLVQHTAAGMAGTATQARFNVFLSQTGSRSGALSEAEKEELFRQFLNWDKRQVIGR
jgi:TRAP transporter TAXI family solute receptor